MEEVYKRLADQYKVALCAPTGKAAKRITEATGISAMTIHRLLEYPHPGEMDPKTGKALITTDPKRDRFNPLEVDVVLADEYAMVNQEVHRNLVDALPNGGCLRMFGDANQLQPIESSKHANENDSQFVQALTKFNGIRLETIHRQSEGSVIITNGARIVRGAMPRRDDDFVINITDEPVHVVADFVMDTLDQGVDFTSIDNQIITPTKIGWVGTEALNVMIQQLLQPTDKYYIEPERHTWAKTDGLRFYEGDKVIFTVNNYDLMIFNGETGIITKLHDDGVISIDFGDRVAEIPPIQEVENRYGKEVDINPQKDLDLAYAITTHKAQGSEYQEVCYVMNRSRSFLLNRKNFYTGISRAKRKVTVITDHRALQLSLYKKGD
jgi:exodeoxyribonuclease V alpha subunit